WPEPAAQTVRDRLLRLVGFSLRRRIERRDGEPRQHVKTEHGLCERLDAEQRAAWSAGRDVAAAVGISALYKRIQSVDRGQEPASGGESPFDKIAARNLAVG